MRPNIRNQTSVGSRSGRGRIKWRRQASSEERRRGVESERACEETVATDGLKVGVEGIEAVAEVVVGVDKEIDEEELNCTRRS